MVYFGDFRPPKDDYYYDGDFNQLVKRINPKKRLQFEFSTKIKYLHLDGILEGPNIKLKEQFLTAELPENEMTGFLQRLFDLDNPTSFSLEELPVEETMKAFFANPKKFVPKH